jgi:hypothetical protein
MPRNPAPRFLTSDYVFSHGHEPRGRGGWAFQSVETREEFWARGGQTLTEAKRQLREAGKTGLWKVLP